MRTFHSRELVCFLGVYSLLCSATTNAADWPRFRGPNGEGISDAPTVPAEWTEDDYNWVTELPGRGHSSPVLINGLLYVTSCDEGRLIRSLLCLDVRDGSIRWQSDVPFTTYKKHKNNSFASSTPCLDEDHVYTVWQSRESSTLSAYDHAGNKVWTCELGPYLHGQGGASSPIVYGDLVVLANDQKQPSFLLAVDRKTGRERWKIPREGKRACYATPCIRQTPKGDEIIFTHCYEGIIGVNPENGKQNWHIDVFGRSSQRALGSPISTGDLVIATSGAVGGDRQLVAVRAPMSETGVPVQEAWRTTRQTPHVPTPLVYRDRLFLVSDQGIASCLNAGDGELIWKGRLGGNFFGSPICVNGKIYCVDVDGNVVVFAAADEFQPLGKTALGEASRATPAVADGVLYLRTETRVYAIGGAS